MRVPRLCILAREPVERVFDLGNVDAAHQSPDQLTLAPLCFVRVDASVIRDRGRQRRRQRQRRALFVVEFRQLLAEFFQTLRVAFARGFTRFLFAHRRQGITPERLLWTIR